MKKSLKIIYTVAAVIAILIIVVVIAINLFADSAVEAVIESAGTKALQVKVAVDDVDLSILGGKIGAACTGFLTVTTEVALITVATAKT